MAKLNIKEIASNGKTEYNVMLDDKNIGCFDTYKDALMCKFAVRLALANNNVEVEF